MRISNPLRWDIHLKLLRRHLRYFRGTHWQSSFSRRPLVFYTWMNRVTECLYGAQSWSRGIGEWLKGLFCGYGRSCPPSSGWCEWFVCLFELLIKICCMTTYNISFQYSFYKIHGNMIICWTTTVQTINNTFFEYVTGLITMHMWSLFLSHPFKSAVKKTNKQTNKPTKKVSANEICAQNGVFC